eukprot:8850930-Pyramimonas_sp.AAC.1
MFTDDVSGSINCALSLKHGPAMNLFRQSLRDIVQDRLVPIHVAPPPDATEHRKFCINLFMQGGANLPQKRLLLSVLPNGDWRKHDRVEFYCSEEFLNRVGKEEIADVIARGLVFALSSIQPHLWPRHRWLGADLAAEELGRLEAAHGLLSAVYLVFCDR